MLFVKEAKLGPIDSFLASVITQEQLSRTHTYRQQSVVGSCRRWTSPVLNHQKKFYPGFDKSPMSEHIVEAMSKLDSMITKAASSDVESGANGNAEVSEMKYANLVDELTRLFAVAISKAFPTVDVPPEVASCNNPKFGDYQCNNAMALFGRMKGKEGAPPNPRATAQAILDALPASPLIEETSLAGPGFINVRINKKFLASHIRDMLAHPNGLKSWAPPSMSGLKVVVDFSSPNVAKEMHVGHLRSTIIGDTIANALEFSGADVLRLNHIGDWGTQFGMLIQYITEKREGGLNASMDDDVSDLQVLYRAAKARFDEEDDFKTRSREAVTKLQSGNPDSLAAWKSICDASRKEFEKIYKRLGVTLKERGESFYNPMLDDVVNDLIERNVAEISDGATCVFVEGENIPLIVKKSDGGYGYASTDMAALKQRINDEKADWIIYVTDHGQAQHFQLVFKAANKAGYLPSDRKIRIDHVGFGLVLGEDGKKFRSRSGDVVRLVELLDEAKDRSIATIKERRPDISEEELEQSSSAMGYGAVKYADLKSHRMTNYRFSFDDMLSLQGNTAVYLLYAHARIASIVRKSGKDPHEIAKQGEEIDLEHASEISLALHVARFPEALSAMLEELAPNRLTEYLYDLSVFFNQFYTECQVVGSQQENSRLMLAEASAVTMRQCLQLLGITPLYRI